jgi:hypothetical protein
MRRLFPLGFVLGPLAALLAGACSSHDSGAPSSPDASAPSDAPPAPPDALPDHVRLPYDAGGTPPVPRAPVVAEMVSQHIDTQGLMFSAGEMQISGEPFAQFFAGRNLLYYDRTYLPPNQYLLPMGDGGQDPVTDLFGFASAVESYEYSKYYMNMVVQETGAGVSLANGPVLAKQPGATPQAKLVTRIDHLLQTVGNDVAGYSTIPPPPNNPRNLLGFGGLRPSFAPYKGFDSSMMPTTEVVTNCNVKGGYGGIPSLGNVVPVYECEYNELNLPDSQLDHVLVPAVLGYAAWKQALWAMDFAGPLHDSSGNPVTMVNASDGPQVGQPNNMVTALDPGAAAGTFIGSTPLEGMWGMNMLENMDNLAELLVTGLLTSDGTTLSGVTKSAAVAYDYSSPLVWFPASVNVAVDATQPFPPVQSMTIADATSRSEDLAALLLGHAMFFAITDARNPTVGQRIGLTLAFDGDPFPADDGQPDGEETAHDRSLAVLRLAFIDLDRIHADPTLGVLVDSATISGGAPTRGNTVTTTSLGHTVVGLTQTLLALNAAVTQYGGANPDPATDMMGALNAAAIHPPGAGSDAAALPNFSQRVRQVLVTQAQFVRDVLTTSSGTVANSATIANGQATPAAGAATVDAQAAAIRALAIGFQITGDETYRTRGRAVAKHLFDAFWSAPALMFRQTEGGPDQIHLTPQIFGWLHSALRETHKVLFVQDDPVLGRNALEQIIAREMKLYMNGWDDLNGNQTIDQGECMGARMQMGEQTLTGELGRDAFGLPVPDRDGDCILELSHGQKGSLMAGEVYFHSP